MLLTSFALTGNRSKPLHYGAFGDAQEAAIGPHGRGNLHPKKAHNPMRILPRFLFAGVVVASSVSFWAQNQPATRPEPPASDPVIPEAVMPGVSSPTSV